MALIETPIEDIVLHDYVLDEWYNFFQPNVETSKVYHKIIRRLIEEIRVLREEK